MLAAGDEPAAPPTAVLVAGSHKASKLILLHLPAASRSARRRRALRRRHLYSVMVAQPLAARNRSALQLERVGNERCYDADLEGVHKHQQQRRPRRLLMCTGRQRAGDAPLITLILTQQRILLRKCIKLSQDERAVPYKRSAIDATRPAPRLLSCLTCTRPSHESAFTSSVQGDDTEPYGGAPGSRCTKQPRRMPL